MLKTLQTITSNCYISVTYVLLESRFRVHSVHTPFELRVYPLQSAFHVSRLRAFVCTAHEAASILCHIHARMSHFQQSGVRIGVL